MGQTLAELKQAMADYAECFDAALVAPALLPKALSDAGARRVSSFLRQLLHRNTVSGSSFGSLIHATVGSAGGSGRLRTKRSGWAA
jgi:hypothetical protein